MTTPLPAEAGSTTLGTDRFVNDRRNLEQEAAGVRITSAVAFSLIIFVLFAVAIFFGFDTFEERLFLAGLGHLALAPLAAYGSLRLGLVLRLAFILSVPIFFVDLVQFVIRVFAIRLSLLAFFGIVFIFVFLLLDAIYIGVLYRLVTTDKAQNNKQTDRDIVQLRADVLRQEANTLRLAGIFGFFGTVLWLFFTLIFLGVSTTATFLTLFAVGHLVLAPFATFLSTVSTGWATAFLLLSVLQTAADFVQIGLRFTSIEVGQLGQLTFDNIFVVGFLLINVLYLMLDVIYVVGAFGYIYASSNDSALFAVQRTFAAVPQFQSSMESGILNTAANAGAYLGAVTLRQRKHE
jgi:hypothetical protein